MINVSLMFAIDNTHVNPNIFYQVLKATRR